MNQNIFSKSKKKAPEIIFSGFFLFFMAASVSLLGQGNGNKIDDPRTSKKILVGVCERIDLYDTSLDFYYEWEYTGYKPDSASMAAIIRLKKDYLITLVLGTWCGDSREQVPRFLKVADLLGFDSQIITIIGVDRQKQAVTRDISHLNIVRVPTFIFYRNGTELGRIIETPEISLEQDMLRILEVKKDD